MIKNLPVEVRIRFNSFIYRLKQTPRRKIIICLSLVLALLIVASAVFIFSRKVKMEKFRLELNELVSPRSFTEEKQVVKESLEIEEQVVIPNTYWVNGRVKSVRGGSFSVQTKDKEFSFSPDKGTKFFLVKKYPGEGFETEESGFSGLEPGQLVSVFLKTGNLETKLLSVTITLRMEEK